MRKVAIVTDSASGIPEDTAGKLGIEIIPMQIIKGGEAFTVSTDITSSEVYEAMRQGSILKTSQPLVPHIEEAYTKALKEAERVISVHISSKLTSTASTCRMVAGMVAPDRIEVIDSSTLTMMYGLACIKAAKRAAAGCGAEEARSVIMDVLSRVRGWLAVPSLKHLSHSGRVSKALSTLSSLLAIKVILRMEGGEVLLEDKYRSSATAYEKMRDLAVDACGGRASSLAYLHGDNPNEAAALEEIVREAVQCDDIITADISPVVGVHTGPGPFGVAILP